MRIDHLHLVNFRQVTEADYEFPASFTAITGASGAGKTTILDALAVMLGIYVDGYHWRNGFSRPIMPMDIRRIPQTPRELDYYYDAVIEVSGKFKNEAMGMKASLSKWPPTYQNYGFSDQTQELIRKAHRLAESIYLSLPVVAYFGSNRFNASYQEPDFDTINALRNYDLCYFDCLTKESGNKRFQNQFRILSKSEHNLNFNEYKSLLQRFVPNWTPDYYYDDELANRDTGRMPIKEDKDVAGLYAVPESDSRIHIAYKMLSDGEQSVLGIVSDIAFRCIIANSGLWWGTAFAKSEGVVLIDELEKSLHPEWQKRIVGMLKKSFPALQFIISTQSPFILQSLDKSEVLSLTDPWIATDPFRLSIEDIADEIMQVPEVTRSERFMDMIRVAEAYYQLAAEERTSEDDDETALLRNQLNELEELYGTDPAFVALLRVKRNDATEDNNLTLEA